MNTLSAHQIAKRYKSKTVVDDVSIEVKNGEIVGLLGPNGAGKTTSFYMMTGLVKHDKGDIKLNGKSIGQLPMHKRAQMGLGYLPQEPSIFRKLSVEDNILAVLEHTKLSKTEQNDKLESLLQEFHISHIRKSLGQSLSGGERRRAEIARALATDPQFILLDEPFAGVDPISVVDIKNIIQHLAERGLGVLITDHNVRETLSVCTQVYVLSDGHIIAKGDPVSISNHPDVRNRYLGHEFKT